jgi:hypothetical protein
MTTKVVVAEPFQVSHDGNRNECELLDRDVN